MDKTEYFQWVQVWCRLKEVVRLLLRLFYEKYKTEGHCFQRFILNYLKGQDQWNNGGIKESSGKKLEASPN